MHIFLRMRLNTENSRAFKLIYVLHIGHTQFKDVILNTQSLVKLNYNVSLLGIDDKRYPYDSNSRPNVGGDLATQYNL